MWFEGIDDILNAGREPDHNRLLYDVEIIDIYDETVRLIKLWYRFKRWFKNWLYKLNHK